MRLGKTGKLEAIVRRLSEVPPFITAPLALLTYILFNQIVRRDFSAGLAEPSTGVLQDVVFWTVMKAFAHVFQYLVPLILAMSVVLWFVRFLQVRRDQKLYERIVASPVHNILHDMTWQAFERIVAQAFRSIGYEVKHTGRAGPDGGIDLVLTRGSEVSLVQCKHWKANRVSVEKVRELYGLMAERGAAQGFLISAGSYTRDAANFAAGKTITLITGSQLHTIIRTGSFAPAPEEQPLARTFVGFDADTCPDCGSPMAERIARKGRHIGQAFLGCTHFPECNGMRDGGGSRIA